MFCQERIRQSSMNFGRTSSPGLRRKAHSKEIFAEKIVADAWRFRRALQLVPALYQREEERPN